MENRSALDACHNQKHTSDERKSLLYKKKKNQTNEGVITSLALTTHIDSNIFNLSFYTLNKKKHSLADMYVSTYYDAEFDFLNQSWIDYQWRLPV